MHIDTIFCLQVSIGDNHHLLVKMDGGCYAIDCNRILAVFKKEN